MSFAVPSRYHALLKVCDLACANAVTTGADRTPDFWVTISVALQDDCPEQSKAAVRIASSLHNLDQSKGHFFKLLGTGEAAPDHDGNQPSLS